MIQTPFPQPEYREGIDADAVCSQCSTVNPEGTLLCKHCGNNLRDQRLLRMAADQMLEADKEGATGSVFLARALPILGLLIVLWFGLNAGRIASMLTTAETSDGDYIITTNPNSFWEGSDAGIFNTLYQELKSNFPSPTVAEAARLEFNPMSSIDSGTYVLYEKLGTMERYVGVARLRNQGDIWYVTAIINNTAEVRGKARKNNEFLQVQWDEGAVQVDGAYYACTGIAWLRDGIIHISGLSDLDSKKYQSVAYIVRNL